MKLQNNLQSCQIIQSFRAAKLSSLDNFLKLKMYLMNKQCHPRFATFWNFVPPFSGGMDRNIILDFDLLPIRPTHIVGKRSRIQC
jgi:hypothetical protein